MSKKQTSSSSGNILNYFDFKRICWTSTTSNIEIHEPDSADSVLAVLVLVESKNETSSGSATAVSPEEQSAAILQFRRWNILTILDILLTWQCHWQMKKNWNFRKDLDAKLSLRIFCRWFNKFTLSTPVVFTMVMVVVLWFWARSIFQILCFVCANWSWER